VLIEVHAAGVNPVDWKIRRGDLAFLLGWRFPKILGFDVSGRVVSTGPAVRKWKPGDLVYGRLDSSSGGAYAEFAAAGEEALALKPSALSHEQAAAVPLAALTAFQGLRDCGLVRPGAEVLVAGASGGVGTFAVQIAKKMGAKVTGVCGTGNIDLVRGLGAERVLDYTKEEIFEPGRLYDVILDAVAAHDFWRVRKFLREEGCYLSTLPSAGLFMGTLAGFVSSKKAALILMKARGKDLEVLNSWIESGELKPVIDSHFSLDEIREAHRRSETGRARGKIIIRVKP
ncbi:MAG: NAD(P)-dependent alcohol dehydrogenase, partial [Elusimicrobia bacterium]|nr:NAD(P)-dependent alcohol dehydrogenase [Elusimicrobiota bacterium]